MKDKMTLTVPAKIWKMLITPEVYDYTPDELDYFHRIEAMKDQFRADFQEMINSKSKHGEVFDYIENKETIEFAHESEMEYSDLDGGKAVRFDYVVEELER